MGECVEKLSHSKCGSSDALQVFAEDDGTFNGFCFNCGEFVPDPYGEGEPPKFVPRDPAKVQAEVQALKRYPCHDLPARRLRKDVLNRFGVRMEVSQEDGQTPMLVYFPYGDGSNLTGWKASTLNLKPKKMWAVGKTKGCKPFGWTQALKSGHPRLYITEGEFDAVALYQMLQDNDRGGEYEGQEYAVISIPHGSGNAKRDISNVMNDIQRVFREVVLVFDQDDAGRKAADEVAAIMPEVKVAKLPFKDANECLIEGASKAAVRAVLFQSQRPKNSRIVYGSELVELARQAPAPGLSWPWEGLTEATRGIRRGETIYFGAGVKMGKSELVNALAAHIIKEHELPVYIVKPEEALPKSYKMLLGKVVGRIFHDPNIEFDYDAFDRANEIVGDKAIFQDIYQFGRWENLKQDIKYTVLNDNVRDVIIDPITCFTNTMNSAEANEHLTLVAAELSQMAKDMDFTAYIFCHLKAPDGQPHERGGPVLSTQFAGSRAMMRSCNYMIGLEGNKDPDLPIESRNYRQLKILEDREFGASATVGLYWDRNTGLFNEV